MTGVKVKTSISAFLLIAASLTSVAASEPLRPATERTPPAPAPKLIAGRPRLFFTPEAIPRLRERWKDPFWAEVKAQAERNLSSPDAMKKAVAAALVWLATGDGSAADTAIAAAEGLCAKSIYTDFGNKYACFCDVPSLVFDWCHGRLSAERRAAFVAALSTRAVEYEKAAVSHFRTHEVYPFFMPYLSTVLAVTGEPGAANRLQEAHHAFLNWVDMMDEQAWGGDYRSYFYQHRYMVFPYLWSSATGENWVARCKYSSALPRYQAYRLHPNGQDMTPGPDDVSVQGNGAAEQKLGAGLFYMAAHALSDPVAQWLANTIRTSAKMGGRLWPDGDDPNWLGFIHYQPDRPSQSPAEAGLPLAARFCGMAVSRSGWGNRQGHVVLWFYNGPRYYHGNHTQNHFEVWRGEDDLAIRGGNYYGAPAQYQTYSDNSIARNCLSFVPFGSAAADVAGGQDGSKRADALDRQKYPRSHQHSYYRGVNYRGEITHFADTPAYSVVCGDATLAYPQVNFYRRDIVHIRPGVFLVRDLYRPAKRLAHTRWILHSRARPSWSTPTEVVQGSEAAGILETKGGDVFAVERGQSRLTVTLLSPSSPLKIRAVGGAGYEDYVDGVNYDPRTTAQTWLLTHPYLRSRLAYSENQWRTELYCPAEEKGNEIIVILQASDIKDAVRAECSLSAAAVGTTVTVRYAGATHRVHFPSGEDKAPVVEAAL